MFLHTTEAGLDDENTSLQQVLQALRGARNRAHRNQQAAWKLSVEAADAHTQFEAVEWRVKQMGGDVVILLVNGSERPAKIKIIAKPLAGRSVHCWGELRTIKVNANGAWLDRVGPLGVRIYSVAAPPKGIE